MDQNSKDNLSIFFPWLREMLGYLIWVIGAIYALDHNPTSKDFERYVHYTTSTKLKNNPMGNFSINLINDYIVGAYSYSDYYLFSVYSFSLPVNTQGGHTNVVILGVANVFFPLSNNFIFQFYNLNNSKSVEDKMVKKISIDLRSCNSDIPLSDSFNQRMMLGGSMNKGVVYWGNHRTGEIVYYNFDLNYSQNNLPSDYQYVSFNEINKQNTCILNSNARLKYFGNIVDCSPQGDGVFCNWTVRK